MEQYAGLKGRYFKALLDALVEIGNLKDRRVLDFGCGTQELKKLLGHNNYVGYDIDPKLSDVATLDSITFDIMVANEVFYEMDGRDIEEVLSRLKPALLLVGISRQSILNKLGAALLHPGALDKTRTPPKKELQILLRHYRIAKKKTVYFLADVYFLERI